MNNLEAAPIVPKNGPEDAERIFDLIKISNVSRVKKYRLYF